MKLIVSALNWIKYFFIQILYKSYFKRLSTNLYFFFKIRSTRKKKIILVYDLFCSPDTYGDFFQFVFLMRYFEVLKKKVYFLILTDKINNSRIKKNDHLNYINQLKEITKKFSYDKNTIIEEANYNSIRNDFMRDDSFILYKSKIIKRKPIYNNCLNLLNVILSTLSKKEINKVLLNIKNLSFKKNIKLPKNYIAIQARYLSKKNKDLKNYDVKKNINIMNLKKLIEKIFKIQKNTNIMIISTETPNFFKKKIGLKDKRIFFSQSFAKNFLETGLLILKARLFLAHNSSGIGFFAIFSKIPFIMTWPYYTLQNEFIWSKSLGKLTSWQNSYQKAYFKVTFKEYEARILKFFDVHEI
jgi:hypothetical protein